MEAEDQPLPTVEVGRIHFDPSNELREGLALFVQNPKSLTLKSQQAVSLTRLPGGTYSDGYQAQEVISYTRNHLEAIAGHHMPLVSSVMQSRPHADILRFHFNLIPEEVDVTHLEAYPAFKRHASRLDVYTDVELHYFRSLGRPVMQRAVKSLKQVMRMPEVGTNRHNLAHQRNIFVTGARLLFAHEENLEPIRPDIEEVIDSESGAKAS